MAYPFIPLPKFIDFKKQLEKGFNCQFRVDNDGTPFPIQFFERMVDGRKIKCAVNFENEQEVLRPSVLRSICARLKIDPKHFGLHLG